MRVRVTKATIDRGVAKDSRHCIVAESIQEASPDAIHIMVDLQRIAWSDPIRRLRHTAMTPRAAQQIILATDQGRKGDIVPTSFTLVPQTTRPMWNDRRTAEGRQARAAKEATRGPHTKSQTPTTKPRQVTLKTREFGLRQSVVR